MNGKNKLDNGYDSFDFIDFIINCIIDSALDRNPFRSGHTSVYIQMHDNVFVPGSMESSRDTPDFRIVIGEFA
jgi:hypothetical protein